MTYQYHDESIIKSLPADTTFVFGSNMAGQHVDGAAKTALEHFGALTGVGRGWSGQSFAIPTMNEHLQQMPLSQIQHYVDDFKIYTKNHPKNKYFLTSIGCGTAGYKVEEIAPMFKGISNNVIFPQSFRPFVEKSLAKLSASFLQTLFQENVIFEAQDQIDTIDSLQLTDSEKSTAKILINTPIFPTDSNGRDRTYELNDILYNFKVNQFNAFERCDAPLEIAGVVLALLELYNINETDFIAVWQGEREIMPPKAAHHAKK